MPRLDPNPAMGRLSVVQGISRDVNARIVTMPRTMTSGRRERTRGKNVNPNNGRTALIVIPGTNAPADQSKAQGPDPKRTNPRAATGPNAETRLNANGTGTAPNPAAKMRNVPQRAKISLWNDRRANPRRAGKTELTANKSWMTRGGASNRPNAI